MQVPSPNNLHIMRFCGFIAFFWLMASCGGEDSRKGENISLPGFTIAPGFDIRLVASEPLLEDPVDMEIDELGNMYVVEMTGNPLNRSGTGKIKLLKDRNGDGIMDTAFLFASRLRMPSGVMRWKQGVIVTDPPEVLYFEDTNRDNIADVRKVMLEGFDATDLESNVNSPYYGVDNWIYVGNGGKSGPGIHYLSKADSPMLKDNAGGQRVRFRPDSFGLEMLSGETQFGHTEDVAGHPLLVENANHIYEAVIEAKYLGRNPGLLVSSATENISDHSSDVFPTTVNPENQMLTDVGVFTAACSITAYLGGAFGEEYDSVVFVCEPAHNLIHTDKLSPRGATHVASRMDSTKEFLTSADPWFRPVNFYIGPDGALYVVDYYRQFIEGPAFMSEEVLKTANLYNGNDKGRIYKITKKNSKPFNMGSPVLSNNYLLEKLSDKNIWWRRTAQRMIIDRNATELVDGLKSLVHTSSPEGRLHALWTLEGLKGLSADVILTSLKDTTNFVRENAIKLAELHFGSDSSIIKQLLSISNDPDARVRLQLACTLGGIKDTRASKETEKMLFTYVDDPWMQIAVLSSVENDKEKLLQLAISNYNTGSPAYPLLVERLSSMLTHSATSAEINALLSQALINNNGTWQPAFMRGMAAGLEGRKNLYPVLNDGRFVLMKSVLQHGSPEIRDEALHILQIIGINKNKIVKEFIRQAQSVVIDHSIEPARRAAAIKLIGIADPQSNSPLLKTYINNNEPVIVQLAAINALSAIPGTTSSNFIIKEWNLLTPEIKDEAINTFMSDRNRISILLEALRSGKITTSLIGWPRSVRLMAGRWPTPSGTTTPEDSALIKEARSLLSRKETTNKDVIKEYYAGISHGADKAEGKKVFSANCGICHQLNGSKGVKVGPDLSTVRNWNPAELVTKILDPNQSIKAGYELWDISLVSGEILQGIIASETPAAVTIYNVNTLPRTVARKDIKSISSSGMTIMPTGFEKQISKEKMAELIAYLKDE